MNTLDPEIHRVRAIFLSDIHLGTRACQAERLLEFLRRYESDYLYLLGDIVDFWAMRRTVYWSPAQNAVVQKILKRARHGTEVVFVPGNHDEALRDYAEISFGDIRVTPTSDYIAADGRRFLLIHSDEFDQATRHHRWLAFLGEHGYSLVIRLNMWWSWWRRQLGRPGYWSLSGFVKRKIKSAWSFVGNFEALVANHARDKNFGGVIGGHIHVAAMQDFGDLSYMNCGDWVDSCTALVEHETGGFEIITWVESDAANSGSRSRILKLDHAARPRALELVYYAEKERSAMRAAHAPLPLIFNRLFIIHSLSCSG